MPRNAWQITREMFLATREVHTLLKTFEQRVRDEAAEPRQASARTDELIIKCLLFSGLRNSEFCRLQVGDTIVGVRRSVFAVRGTPREDRTVYVPRSLSRLVQDYVALVRPGLVPVGVRPKDRQQPLLLNERGRPYERTALYRRVVRVLSEAGLNDRASVQLLRHTYGYLAYLRTGGNLLFVQRQLGHAHPMVTSIYAQFVDECYPDLADRLEPAALATEGAPGM